MKAIDVRRSLAQLVDPPPALNVWEWAELRRQMGRDVTAKPGKYSVDFAPYQREPQESFTDPEVQTTVLYWGKRLGKTEMLNNLHGSVIEQDPRNILHVMPTLDSARKHRKQFFNPMVRSTPELKTLIREQRTKDADNTLLSVGYPGGNFSMIGANSPTGFRQVQAPVVCCDEIDAMENTVEGDPVALAFGRAENYSDCIQVVSSTATTILSEDAESGTGSRIHDWWLKSDQRKWFVLNPCCGKRHVLAWANVKWPEPHKHEETFYECPDCGAKWNDAMRVEAIRAGEWRATAPFRGVRGYWLNGLNSTFKPKKGYITKLHQFAAEFHDAYTSGKPSRITWKNTFLCEPHFEAIEHVDHAPLLRRLEDYTPETLPPQVAALVASADIQKSRIELDITGVGADDETWGVETVVLHGDLERPEVWQQLGNFLRRTWRRADGVRLRVSHVALDSRYKPKMVRHFVKTCGLPRVWAVVGSSVDQPTLVQPRFNEHYQMYIYHVATSTAKDIIFARLRLEQPGPGYMHFPTGGGYNEEYFRQLCGEAVRIEYRKGFPKRVYVKMRDRNEALDKRVYALAATEILPLHIEAIQKNLKASPEQADEPRPEEPPPVGSMVPKQRRSPMMPFPQRPGWVNGWKR